MGDFSSCIGHILEEEGGYVLNPRDPGGETKYGISKRAYPHKDIASLTVDSAKDIYFRDYWSPIKGDDLPVGLDLLVFDGAVNQGVTTAARLLQKALKLNQDGVIGDITLLTAKTQMPRIINHYAAERALRYECTRNEEVFGRGWFRRLFRTYAKALQMVSPL